MTKEEAIEVCKRVRLMFYPLSDKVSDAMKMAIEALSQPEQNHLTDKASEETDDKDKLKLVEEKLDLLGEKIQQLEKDVRRLEMGHNIFPVETSRTYPNITSTGISAYAGPEFGGVCFGIPTNAP